MTRRLGLLSLLAALLWVSTGMSGQDRSGDRASAVHGQRRLAALHRRHPRHEVLAARSDQRLQLQQARSRLALQDRQPRPASRVQARRHAARWSRASLYTTAGTRRVGRRARRQDRRADLGAQPCAKASAPPIAPRQLSGRGVVVLDRRQGRRAHPLRHDRLPPGRAQREDRRDRSARFGKDGVVDLKDGAVFGNGPADRSRDRRDRPALDADRRRRTSSSSARRSSEGTTVDDAQQHQGPGARVRRADRQAALDVQHDPAPGRVRQRHVGERVVGDQRQHRRVDADHGRRGARPRLSAGRRRRRRTTTAAIAPATTCSATASSASI